MIFLPVNQCGHPFNFYRKFHLKFNSISSVFSTEKSVFHHFGKMTKIKLK